MFYPQELIDEIRIQNEIVSVVSEYVALKPKGSSYFGLCPFHNETTPSFSVSVDKQFYYCFGCGESGNVYSFIMRMENCDFPEAVKRLADRVHIALPEPEYSEEAKQFEKLKKQIYDIHKLAGRYYYAVLNSENGIKAAEYLKNRGVISEIQKKFGIGYAPSGRGHLHEYLKKKGFDRDAMIKSGLVMESKDGRGLYDRFFNRLMFPIFDMQGRVVAFGGRVIDKGEPKYLNSPETAVFNKSKTLYGMNFAKMARKREIILVEGYMDMISIYQAGFPNVVAGLGTAFNNDHARTLHKIADRVILLYDSDEAGEKAALRAIPVLVNNGFEVMATQVYGAKDADEFIKKYGSDAFGKLLVDAVNHIVFQINCIKKNYNMENAEHRVRFAEEAAKVLSEVHEDIERDVYTKETSVLCGIDEAALKSRIMRIRDVNDREFIKSAEKKRQRVYSQTEGRDIRPKGIIEAQKAVLSLSVHNERILRAVSKVLKPYEFDGDVYKALADKIFSDYERGIKREPADIVSCFESLEEQNTVAAVFAVKLDLIDAVKTEKALNENVKLIKKNYTDNLLAKAETVEDIKILVENKRKLDELNISISES
ncbi:MAG: DNA primase [Candidatus Metalachnospira sp.]|nr:DNA primase [Candidatus Metalachnospira sp.]